MLTRSRTSAVASARSRVSSVRAGSSGEKDARALGLRLFLVAVEAILAEEPAQSTRTGAAALHPVAAFRKRLGGLGEAPGAERVQVRDAQRCRPLVLTREDGQLGGLALKPCAASICRTRSGWPFSQSSKPFLSMRRSGVAGWPLSGWRSEAKFMITAPPRKAPPEEAAKRPPVRVARSRAIPNSASAGTGRRGYRFRRVSISISWRASMSNIPNSAILAETRTRLPKTEEKGGGGKAGEKAGGGASIKKQAGKIADKARTIRRGAVVAAIAAAAIAAALPLASIAIDRFTLRSRRRPAAAQPPAAPRNRQEGAAAPSLGEVHRRRKRAPWPRRRALVWKDASVGMATVFGDGSGAQGDGFMGKLLGAGKRSPAEACSPLSSRTGVRQGACRLRLAGAR